MNGNKLAIGFTAIALVGVSAGAYYLFTQSNTENSPNSGDSSTVTTTPVSNADGNTPTSSTPGSYKDGSYSAEGSYVSPAGNEKISVTMTLQNGTVTNVSVTPKATDRDSKRYQTLFSNGVRSFVVGKKIDDVNLSRVSGSSLTSRGFNEAVDKIQEQAKQI